jgi:hypothetical protein
MRNGLKILRIPVEFYFFGAAKMFPGEGNKMLKRNFEKFMKNSLEYFDAIIQQLKVLIYMNVK